MSHSDSVIPIARQGDMEKNTEKKPEESDAMAIDDDAKAGTGEKKPAPTAPMKKKPAAKGGGKRRGSGRR